MSRSKNGMPASDRTPTVFLVDPDRPTRDWLMRIVEALGVRALAFESADAFCRAYGEPFPGCLVLEVRLPDGSGLDLYQQLLAERKRVPAVFIASRAEVRTAVAAMKTGAIDFLEKPFDRQTFIGSVTRALAIDADWRRRQASFDALDARFSVLNDRDRETLALVLAGDSNKVMASKLAISQRAVEMRRAVVIRKLSVTSLAELFDLAARHRLLREQSSGDAISMGAER